MAWATLTELMAFLNVQNNLRDALQNIFGDFTDRIDYVAHLPEAIWRQGVGNARIIVQAAVLPDPAGPRRSPDSYSLWRPAKRG